MRTLKKTLCLVLAVVMVLGLCAVSVSAIDYDDFTDKGEIKHEEAVKVLTGLGVIEGKGENNFDPTATLTRAEACVIITKLLGMEKAAVANDTFTDTASVDWARKYIGFCQSEGIVSGYGDGRFGPNDKLTGSQWALMVLHAIGFNDEYEGVGGPQWEITVARMVRRYKLDEKLDDFEITEPISRDDACQLAFAGATEVSTREYREGYFPGSAAGNASAWNRGYDVTGQTLLQLYYDNNVESGVLVTSNQANSLDEFTTAGSKAFNVETDASLIGHRVNVYFDETYKNAQNPGEVFAVVDKTVEVPISGRESASELKSKLNQAGVIDGVAEGATRIVRNGTIYNGSTGITINGTTLKSPAVTLDATDGTTGSDLGDFSAILVYTNNSEESSIIGFKMPDTYTVQAVVAVNTAAGKESISLSGKGRLSTSADKDEVRGEEGLNKGDIVLAYTCGAITELYAPEVVSGTVSSRNDGKNSKSVTIGKTYTASDSFADNVGFTYGDVTGITVGSVQAGKDYTLYLDKEGDLAMVSGITTVGDVIYVVKTYSKKAPSNYGTGADEYYIQAVNTDAEEVNYRVYYDGSKYKVSGKNNGTALSPSWAYGADITEGALYTVSTAYDTTLKANMASLSALTDPNFSVTNNPSGTKAAIAKADKASKLSGASNYYFANDVKFIYVGNYLDDLTIATKEGMQNVEDSLVYVLLGNKATSASTNYDVHYVFVAQEVSSSSQSIAYASERDASTSTRTYEDNGVTRYGYVHSVYVDGESQQILTNDAAALSGWVEVSTDETTGLSTTKAYTGAGNLEQTPVSETQVTNLYNGQVTTAGVTDANGSDPDKTKIVDLTKNDIETMEQFYALFESGATVKAAFLYDTNTGAGKTISLIYITEASVGMSLSGTSTLTASFTTALKNVDTVTYSWTRGGKSVEVTDSKSNTLATDGKAGEYGVSATITLYSGATVSGKLPNSGKVTINTGVVQPTINAGGAVTNASDLLTNTTNAGVNKSVAVTYQWQVSSDGGTTWTNIPSATTESYTGTTGEVVRVVATYTLDNEGTYAYASAQATLS